MTRHQALGNIPVEECAHDETPVLTEATRVASHMMDLEQSHAFFAGIPELDNPLALFERPTVSLPFGETAKLRLQTEYLESLQQHSDNISKIFLLKKAMDWSEVVKIAR